MLRRALALEAPVVPDDVPADGPAPAPQDPLAQAMAEAAASVPDPAMDDPEKVKARLKLLEAQLEESFKRSRETGDRLKDTHERLLRTAAEFENYKKRAQKEKEDASKFGTEKLLKDFLPVMDNLERALDHAEQHDPKQVLEGVRLVQKLFESTLARHGVVGFSAVGKPFDPAFHEALMQQESDSPPNTVVSEMARGYKLHDRLVRPAAVVVSKSRPVPGEPPPAGGSTGGDGGGPPPSA
jgi:molecular chaperone GrpE